MINNTIFIVFDIDETLLHLLSENEMEQWSKMNTIDYNDGNKIILRPHIEKLFDFLKENENKIKPAIWTYGNEKYATSIAELLKKQFNLSNGFFLFTWGKENIIYHSTPKNMNYVYTKFKNCNKTNTFLVDNLYTNIAHTANKENSILIESFYPFKSFHENNTSPVIAAENDNCFLTLIDICKTLIDSNKNADNTTIPIFSKENIKKLDLLSYLNQIETKSLIPGESLTTTTELMYIGNTTNQKGGKQYRKPEKTHTKKNHTKKNHTTKNHIKKTHKSKRNITRRNIKKSLRRKNPTNKKSK